MVWGTRGSSGCGVIVMGIVYITALHALGRGEPELSPSIETESSWLGNSSRMTHIDGDPLRAMPLTAMPDSFPLGGGLKSLEQLAMNSRASKWVAYVLRELDAE
jgi:hypothetical protein